VGCLSQVLLKRHKNWLWYVLCGSAKITEKLALHSKQISLMEIAENLCYFDMSSYLAR
jgi:hypothetical protein